MGWQFRKKGVILVAPENGNYGVSPTLNASNYKGLLVYDMDIGPAAEDLKRDPLRQSFTKVAPRVGRKSVQMTFGTELKGVGSQSNPESATVLHDLLKGCGMKAVDRDWGDGTSCTEVWWCELQNADNCSSFYPFMPVWLVQDPSGTPQNTKAVVIGLIRRKDADSDTTRNDCVVLAVPSGTSVNLAQAQEIHQDSSGSPGALLATVNVDAGQAVMHRGSAFMPTSDYDTVRNSSVSVAGFEDSILHLAPGGIGSFAINITDGDVPKLRFTFNCLWNNPADQSPPSGVDFFTHLPPGICRQDLILAESGASGLSNIYKPNFSSFSLDLQNQIVADKNCNANECTGEFMLTDRNPQAGLNPAAESLSEFNPWTAWAEGEGRLLSFCLGYQNVGNRVSLVLPEAVYKSLKYTDRDGRTAYDMGIVPSGDTDDEIVLIFG